MSLEQAILEHAAAMREVAAGLVALAGCHDYSATRKVQDVRIVDDGPLLTEYVKAGNVVDSSGADDELEQAVEKVEAAAKEESRKNVQIKMTVAPSDPKPDASGAAEPAGTQTGAESLSYEKDVKPVLIKLAGKCGKQALTDLIAEFGVAKADKLDAEQLVAAKAKAEALISHAENIAG